MNAVLAFIASFLMVFFTVLIVAAVLFGLLLAGLNLHAAPAHRDQPAHRDDLERRRRAASASEAQSPAGDASELS